MSNPEQLSLGRRRIRVDNDWTIIVEDSPLHPGMAFEVHLQHRNGSRIPPGPNTTVSWKVEAEVERLRQSVVGPLYDNPLPNSGWLWIGGALALGAAAWWLTSKKSTTWNCRAGMRCTHFVKGDSWQAKNLLDNSLAIYSVPPNNLKDLTLEETAPDGSYHVYNSIKAAVMTDGLPEFLP